MQILTKSNRSLTLDLLQKEDSTVSSHSPCGQLVVHAEECFSSKTTTEMILRCSDLEHKDLFSRIVWVAKFLSLSLSGAFLKHINDGWCFIRRTLFW